MDTVTSSYMLSHPTAILDRQSIRRTTGIPTVSLLVGPIGVGVGTWRRWSTATGRNIVVTTGNHFPYPEWVRTVVERIDLPTLAVQSLAQRANRDPDEFLASWRGKTSADREQFWNTLAPNVDDDLLRAVASLDDGRGSRNSVVVELCEIGERIIPMIVRLAASATCPGVLFVSHSSDHFSPVAHAAANWAVRAPAIPIATAAPAEVWNAFLTNAPESRTKALLREGEVVLPAIDTATAKRALTEAGASASAATAVAANGADVALVESAVGVIRATIAPPATQVEDDRARSAAERFLFEFLESLPETAGRFELNASLDFDFGRRPAEVDLLCREPRIALEIDGYFHFRDSAAYRRDRAKDWELQRRRYLVLRFLAEDVIPQLELIRDRILAAIVGTSDGELS